MRWCCLSFVALSFLGCGPREPVPVPVHGSVTVDGKPLAEGKIFFIFLGKVPEILDIRDGRFEGKVLPGERRVEIAAYRPYQIPPDVPQSMHALMEGGKENFLPLRYHRNSILKAEVKDAEENAFRFELTSDPD